MLVISFFRWWYGRGFGEYLAGFVDGLRDAADFFSIRLLVRNLFAPFRQISAERRDNLPLSERIHAWSDLLISRLVGAAVRFMILIAGTVVLVIRVAIGLVLGILWPMMPLLVIYSVMLFVRGVVF